MSDANSLKPRIPKPKEPRGRKRGRPRGRDKPDIAWHEVDQILVHGEIIRDPDTGASRFHYPSYRDIAKRYGVSGSLIGLYAKQHDCLARRNRAATEKAIDGEDAGGGSGEDARPFVTEFPLGDAPDIVTPDGQDEVTPAAVSEQIARDRVLRMRARNLSASDQLDIVDACLREFAKALESGRFRCDSPADLHTLLKLREKLDADVTRAQAGPEITLAQIQERHKVLMDQLGEIDPWVIGEAEDEQPARAVQAADTGTLDPEPGPDESGVGQPGDAV